LLACGAPPLLAAEPIRVGVIGLDTSHAIAFTRVLNAEGSPPELVNCRVVAAYPKGSEDIESSVSRVPKYTEQIQGIGVKIVNSIDALIEQVDCVLLETNDGRPHLRQVLPVLKAGKPVFVDKPVAGTLADAIAIYNAAAHYGVPLFSSSSLRWIEGAQEARGGAYGDIVGATTFSPASLEKTHPDLFWYGIHGVEALFTVMGPGCESVTRVSTADTDVVVGAWSDGRVGTMRGTRSGKRGYGGHVFGTKESKPLGGYQGYEPLLRSIVHFFRTGEAPVTRRETLEIYAFMEAADESKRRGGVPVSIAETMKKATREAKKRFKP
jgi:predicted dehydrogenase